MQEILFKISYFERGSSVLRVFLFFLLNPVPFHGQNDQKQKGLDLKISRSLRYEKSSEKYLY